MKNIKALINMLLNREIISREQAEDILKVLEEEYPNMDLHKDELVEYKEVITHIENSVNEVITINKLAEIYHISAASIKNAINLGKFNKIRKSKGTWIIDKNEAEKYVKNMKLKRNKL